MDDERVLPLLAPRPIALVVEASCSHWHVQEFYAFHFYSGLDHSLGSLDCSNHRDNLPIVGAPEMSSEFFVHSDYKSPRRQLTLGRDRHHAVDSQFFSGIEVPKRGHSILVIIPEGINVIHNI